MSERGPGAQPAGDHVLRPCCRLIPGCRMSRQTGRHSHLRRAYRPARRFPDGQGIQPAPCAFPSHLFLPLSNFAYTKFYTRPHHKMRVTPNLKQASVRKFAQPLNLDLCLLRFCTQRLVFLPLAPPVLQPRYPAGFCFPCLTPPDQVYLFLHLQFLFMRHSFAPPISDSFLFLCLLLREHIINHQVVAAYSSYTQFHGACLLHVGFFRKDTPLFCRYDKPDSAFWDFIYFTLVVADLV